MAFAPAVEEVAAEAAFVVEIADEDKKVSLDHTVPPVVEVPDALGS